MKIMKALISVSDKNGIVEFASALCDMGWEIIATGGTMTTLRNAGLPIINISDVTGFPEICDGRVKTLHPKIHGALLGRRDLPDHLSQLEANGIGLIDMVVVNLYPFEETVSRENVSLEDAIENIDIGGPSMLRSAAKNFRDVTVVCNPADYDIILKEIKENGNTSLSTRFRLAAQAFTRTALYDSRIAEYICKKAGIEEKLFLDFDKIQSLRYGENPHQQASFYKTKQKVSYSVAHANQIAGKELSYNNIQDANAALSIVKEFKEPFCVALKHANPCGAAVGENILEAWTKAFEADKVSIYGGIIAFNRELTEEVAKELKPIFLEIVIAPSFSKEALKVLESKKNLRLLEVDMTEEEGKQNQYVGVNGGLLVQDVDSDMKEITPEMCVSGPAPSRQVMADMNFGWKIVKHVKSNAIVVVKNGATVGVGAGQMNRVGSAKIALEQAFENKVFEGLVMASDGFLPFDDTVTLAADHGVVAIVQPGGSIRDEDCIEKAREKGIIMAMTGMRHFKH